MKKTILILIAILYYQLAFAQLPNNIQSNKVNIQFNKNVELLGFGYFILFESADIEHKALEIDGKTVLKKDWHNYGYHFHEKYKRFANNANLMRSTTIVDHLWLDYLIGFLTQLDDFPYAKLSPTIEQKAYIRFSKTKDIAEAKANAQVFIDGLNSFYKDVDFDKYIAESKPFYTAAIKQFNANIDGAKFIETMESFFRRKLDGYTLIPSLTISKSMGFSTSRIKNGSINSLSVFGAVDFQKFIGQENLDMGFGNPNKLQQVVIHEVGHAFVNPVLDQISKEKIRSSEKLFVPIQTAMEAQGYNTWNASLYEFFVRACEVVIAKKMGKENEVKRLEEEYIHARKFIYLPLLIDVLEKYDQNKSYSFEDALLKAFEQLNSLTNKPQDKADSIEVTFHTEDIDLFWKVFDKTSPKFSGKVWQEEYLNKGSIGLQGFVKNRIESGKKLGLTIKKNHKYYEAIRQNSLSIVHQKAKFYNSFAELKKIYPTAIFPDVYFVIGRNNTGGTTFNKGLIVGAERFGEALDGIKPALKKDEVDELVAHELIHFQQKYVHDNSLLSQCIKEGSADFLGELISGGHTNTALHEYAEKHQTELWQDFLTRKNGSDLTGWLYYQKDKSRPKDLGYWIGYKITKAYYQKMDNKKQAIMDILNINDFKEFLSKSGYHPE